MNSAALQRALPSLVIVLAALSPFVLGGLYVAEKHQWAAKSLAELEPRFARLTGLANSQDEMRQTAAKAAELLAQQTYGSELDPTQAGNDAQQRIRQIFTQAGLNVQSSQVLPPKVEKQFERIPLVVRAEGRLLALQSALMVLENQKPSFLIDEISIQTMSAVGRAQQTVDQGPRLSAQFRLTVLRVRP